MYLGFGGKQLLQSELITSIWSDNTLAVQQYQDTNPPIATSVMQGLWNLGNNFISAGREVNFIAEQEVRALTASCNRA